MCEQAPVTIGEPGRDMMIIAPSSKSVGGIIIRVQSPDSGIALTREEAGQLIRAVQAALAAPVP